MMEFFNATDDGERDAVEMNTEGRSFDRFIAGDWSSAALPAHFKTPYLNCVPDGAARRVKSAMPRSHSYPTMSTWPGRAHPDPICELQPQPTSGSGGK
jgi:hypothetical protein